jgi:hypothetical protein
VEFEEHGSRPEGLSIFILDPESGAALPLVNNGFEVEITRNTPVRKVRLVIGTEAFAIDQNDGAPIVPLENQLDQNYPNPFNLETQIRFQLGSPQQVTLEIFDLLGRRIRRLSDAPLPAGSHLASWDSRDDAGMPAPSGVYLYRLVVGDFSATRKMLLLR